MQDKEKFPVCDRTECFGCENGCCVVLSDNNFKKECPFFKTNEQVENEKEYCRERREKFGIRGSKTC